MRFIPSRHGVDSRVAKWSRSGATSSPLGAPPRVLAWLALSLAVAGCEGSPEAPAAPSSDASTPFDGIAAPDTDADTDTAADAATADEVAPDADAETWVPGPDALTACPVVSPGSVPWTDAACAVALECSYVTDNCCGVDYFDTCTCDVGEPLGCSVSDYCGPAAQCSPGCSLGKYKTSQGCQDCATVGQGIRSDMAVGLAAIATCSSPADCVVVPYTLCGRACEAAVPKSAVDAPKAVTPAVSAAWCPGLGTDGPSPSTCWFDCSAGPASAPMACLSGRCARASVCKLGAALPGDSCDDQDPCTLGDTCTAPGTCTGTPKNCDDGDPCTADSCTADAFKAGSCHHKPSPLCTLKKCSPQGQLLWASAIAQLPAAATQVDGQLALLSDQPQALSADGLVQPLAMAAAWFLPTLRVGPSGAATSLQLTGKKTASGFTTQWTACSAPHLLSAPVCTQAAASGLDMVKVWGTDVLDGKVIAAATFGIGGAYATRLWDTSADGPLVVSLPPALAQTSLIEMAAVDGPDIAVLARAGANDWTLVHQYGSQAKLLPLAKGAWGCLQPVLFGDGGAALVCAADGSYVISRWFASGLLVWSDPWPPADTMPLMRLDGNGAIAWGVLKTGELHVRRYALDGAATAKWLLPKEVFKLVEPVKIVGAWGGIVLIGHAPGAKTGGVALRWSAPEGCPP